jgi:hypothetical protein
MTIDLHPETRLHISTFHGVHSANDWGRHFFEYLLRKFPENFEKNLWHFSPVDYGRLWAAVCWLPFFKNLIIQYTGRTLAYYQLKYNQAKKVILAHSYGAFAVVEALKIYRELRADILILTGSVAYEDTPWTSIAETGGIGKVYNFMGGRDFIQLCAGSVGLGKSGHRGFKDLANGLIQNIKKSDFDHDDFLKNFGRFERIILEVSTSENL